MNAIIVNILDCSIQRKLKSTQNLSFFVFIISSMLLFLTTLTNSLLPLVFNSFLILIIISFTLVISISLFFFKKKRIGQVTITKEKVILNDNESYKIYDMYLDLNTNTKDNKINSKGIPFWGNYIKHKNQKVIIEFEPNFNLINAMNYIEVKNSKRSILQLKTSEIIKEFLNFIWVS